MVSLIFCLFTKKIIYYKKILINKKEHFFLKLKQQIVGKNKLKGKNQTFFLNRNKKNHILLQVVLDKEHFAK